jgi:hypothetical protein
MHSNALVTCVPHMGDLFFEIQTSRFGQCYNGGLVGRERGRVVTKRFECDAHIEAFVRAQLLYKMTLLIPFFAPQLATGASALCGVLGSQPFARSLVVGCAFNFLPQPRLDGYLHLGDSTRVPEGIL